MVALWSVLAVWSVLAPCGLRHTLQAEAVCPRHEIDATLSADQDTSDTRLFWIYFIFTCSIICVTMSRRCLVTLAAVCLHLDCMLPIVCEVKGSDNFQHGICTISHTP